MSIKDIVSNRVQFYTRKAVVTETEGYQDLWSRPYQSNVNDSRIIDDFMDITEDGSNVNPFGLAHIAQAIIAPATVPENRLVIPEGFIAKRLVFMIAVEFSPYQGNTPSVTIISGYTDIADISFSGQIAGDTKFYINSISTINQATGTRPTESAQMIASSINEAYGFNNFRRDAYQSQTLITMRPTDVLTEIDALEEEDYDSFDLSNIASPNRVIKSRRRNNLPSRFITDVVDSVLNTQDIGAFNGRNSNRYGQARNIIREDSTAGDLFTRELRRYREFTEDGFIYWNDLCDIVPDLDDNTAITSTGQVDRRTIEHRARLRDVNDWAGADNETVLATIIAQAFPAIMTSALITYVKCSFSNDTLDGEPYFELSRGNNEVSILSFDDSVDPKMQYRQLRSLVTNELLRLLSYGGHTVSVNVEFDIQLDGFIEISLDGGEWIPYGVPVFCDAINSPIISRSSDNLTSVARNLKSLITAAIN